MASDKLTIQALKQHDRIHPKLQATTGSGSGAKDAAKAPSEERRKRTTSTAESVKSGPKPGGGASKMSIFRLVAATRAWQRLAKKKRAETPVVKYENTYRLEPDERSKFSATKVERVLRDVMETRLRNVTYNADTCRRVTTDLATVIKSRTKTLNFPRYKLVCNVVIMENKGQGSEVASRCLWNAGTDSFASYTYRNATLVAVANVHGVYFE